MGRRPKKPKTQTRATAPTAQGKVGRIHRVGQVLTTVGIALFSAALGYLFGQAEPDLRFVDSGPIIVNIEQSVVDPSLLPDTIMMDADFEILVRNRSFVRSDFVNDIAFIPVGFAPMRVEVLDLDRTPIGRRASRKILFRLRTWALVTELQCNKDYRVAEYSLKLRSGSGATIRRLDGEPALMQAWVTLQNQWELMDSVGKKYSGCSKPR